MAGCAVLQAPPGAGKTTRVPLALLDEKWLAGRKIIMLEPRRLAARAAARRMAAMLGEKVGETVGYRMRMDTNVGSRTRIEVVTEGVLTRLLQADQALENVGLVIFDEFHERSLQADLGLALCAQSRSLLREDLRILVMSATLNGEPVARLLGGAPIVTSAGRAYPVETRYLGSNPDERLERRVAAAVMKALRADEGDILVFLPGAGEIGRTKALLDEGAHDPGLIVAPLHGNLPQEAQDRAIEPDSAGTRKVVLSTSIAETSLTIEGIRIVIDCGLMRVPRFSPRSGMTRLETIRLSRASADQRRGRAGRLGLGICYRLWSEGEHEGLQEFSVPEILEADLAPLALELAGWGAEPDDLVWLDVPSAAAYAQARTLLAELGALAPDGIITPHGRMMAGLPFHPRLAHMMLKGKELGLGGPACDLAALLSERDILRAERSVMDADLRLRLEMLRDLSKGGRPDHAHMRGVHVDIGSARRALAEARQWRKSMNVRDDGGAIESCGLLLAFAYPDRIAQKRPGAPGRYLLRNGAGAYFDGPQLLSESSYIVVADLDGRRRESRIFLAAPIMLEEIQEHFGEQLEREEVVAWDDAARAVRAQRRECLGALVLRESSLAKPSAEAMIAGLIEGIRREGPGILPWEKAARRMQERMLFMRHHDSSWPDVSDEVLMATLEEWLAPHLAGRRRAEDLAGLDLTSILSDLLSWEQRSALDAHAPTHFTVPSGSRIPIDYANPEAPSFSVRLQEMFGQTETPRIARGRVPLTIHLLSPAQRPVQVTRDLANFWRTTYFDVKKDLKGRYPKHYWPDDPMQAVPTSRVRPR